MKRQQRSFSPIVYYGVMGVLTGVIGLYIWHSLNGFRAFELSRNFLQAAAASPSHKHFADIIEAMGIDRNHPEYPYLLANALYEAKKFDEAEQWLRKAILFDPANHLYYYQLGHVSHSRGGCTPLSIGNDKNCPTAAYFLTALHNYPRNSFLRAQVCFWYYYFYDQAAAVRLIEEILTSDDGIVIYGGKIDFAQFLYETQLDDESDLELARILPTKPRQCTASFIPGELSEQKAVELGSDDGSGEWGTRLSSFNDRVKKVICLPENLAEYQSASLKILMNRTEKAPLNIKLSLNRQEIPISERQISHVPDWHEIPIDMAVLHGSSRIHVYIRAEGSSSETSLVIWGDQDTLGTNSVFNFRQTKDLSSETGRQTGEYMIRLVLRK